jgi:hypothetical protein
LIHKTQQPLLTLHYYGILISFIRSTKQHTTTHKFKESIILRGSTFECQKKVWPSPHPSVQFSHSYIRNEVFKFTLCIWKHLPWQLQGSSKHLCSNQCWPVLTF